MYTILVLTLLTVGVSAQQFVSGIFYNGPGNGTDQAVDIAVNDSNNAFVTGVSYGGAATKDDIYTAKYYMDIMGTRRIIWSARYNSPINSGNCVDVSYSMVIDVQSNVYVCGTSYKYGDIASADYITLKYNSAGVLQWAVRYNGTGDCYDFAYALAVDNSGNVYVTGVSYGSSGADQDYTTVKYNSAGVQQWVARYDGPVSKEDEARSIVLDSQGNLYVTGKSIASGQGFNIVTIKYNTSGAQQWLRTYNGPANDIDYAVKISKDRADNIIVGGTSKETSTQNDYVVIKYNSAGTQQWASRYNGTVNQNDSLKSMGIDIYNNIYVTGGANLTSNNSDYVTIKYNPLGSIVWTRTYNGTGNGTDIATDISVSNRAYDPESLRKVYVCITGVSTGSGTGNDYATLYYDENGNEMWREPFNRSGSSNDAPSSCATSNLVRMVYVTGMSNNDYGTIAYNKDLSQITEQPVISITGFSSNYPNPFNPVTKISFNLVQPTDVKISIYNVQGQEIQSLINRSYDKGSYSVDWDASNYTSGVYFYVIKTGYFTETKKMVLTK